MSGLIMELDMKVMPVGAAIQQAKLLSGMTLKQIAVRMEIHESVAKKLFAEHQDRLPDILEVVAICNALGNRFLLDWMLAQLEPAVAILGGHISIPSQFCSLSAAFGELSRATGEALTDGKINASEANAMMKRARSVRESSDKLMANLEPIAGQIFTAGKWVSKTVCTCETEVSEQ